MNPLFRTPCLLFLGALLTATSALAQKSDADAVSFGKRTPTLDELNKAFAPSELQAMNIRVTGPIKKTIDMELVFPFGSAEISPQVKAQLGTLGEYLQKQGSKLGRGGFRIEGHTDAVGAASFNQLLSDRRAQAVRDFLVSEYKIDRKVLAAAGVGAANLKDGRNPASEVNRRVEFSVTIKE